MPTKATSSGSQGITMRVKAALPTVVLCSSHSRPSCPRPKSSMPHRARLEHRQQFLFRRLLLAKPRWPFSLIQDNRHPIVQLAHNGVRAARQDGATQHFLGSWRFPFRPQPGHDHLPIVAHRNRVGLLLFSLGVGASSTHRSHPSPRGIAGPISRRHETLCSEIFRPCVKGRVL
jgi:hypothetical protein